MTVVRTIRRASTGLVGLGFILTLLMPTTLSAPIHPLAVQQSYPTASITYLPTIPIVNQPVKFNGSSSTGTLIKYTWIFGDGTPPFTNVTATHAYSQLGTFSVSLTVEDSQNINNTLQIPILISNGPPAASFTATPRVPVQGTSVIFDASTSTDPNGRIVSYAWDWGDGTTNGTTGSTGMITNPRIAHAYAAAGTYTVTLTVTDNLALSGSSTTAITVKTSDIPPVAVFAVNPQKSYVGDTVSFNGTSSYDPDGIYPVILKWQFGDGAFQNGGNITTHSYEYSGLFNATLTVVDDSGSNSSLIQQVFVLPKLSVTVSQSTRSGGSPLHVSFTAQASGGQGPYAYQWSFGDGQTALGQFSAHNYTATGTYVVELKAIDSAGHVALSNTTITVSPLYLGFLPIPYVLSGIGVAAVVLVTLLVVYAYFVRNARRRHTSEWGEFKPRKRQNGNSRRTGFPSLIKMLSFSRSRMGIVKMTRFDS